MIQTRIAAGATHIAASTATAAIPTPTNISAVGLLPCNLAQLEVKLTTTPVMQSLVVAEVITLLGQTACHLQMTLTLAVTDQNGYPAGILGNGATVTIDTVLNPQLELYKHIALPYWWRNWCAPGTLLKFELLTSTGQEILQELRAGPPCFDPDQPSSLKLERQENLTDRYSWFEIQDLGTATPTIEELSMPSPTPSPIPSPRPTSNPLPYPPPANLFNPPPYP